MNRKADSTNMNNSTHVGINRQMMGWKNEKQDEIQMYAQPVDNPSQQMEPSLACYEFPFDWQTFPPPGKAAVPASCPGSCRTER